jgi:hypothetical protein
MRPARRVAELGSLGRCTRLDMPTLLPKQFGRRERWLTAIAVVAGLIVAGLASLTRFGAYGGWILFTIIGMFVFLAVGRQQRAFVAGVFGLALFTVMSLSLCAVTLWRDHESLNKEHAFVIAMLFLWLVVAPLAAGSFISWIRRHEENAA